MTQQNEDEEILNKILNELCKEKQILNELCKDEIINELCKEKPRDMCIKEILLALALMPILYLLAKLEIEIERLENGQLELERLDENAPA